MAQTLGERLKAVRRRFGMSQEELATRSGVAQEAIGGLLGIRVISGHSDHRPEK